ncbi:small ribosomal subunit protein mS25-like [Xenentodon cancila]
MRQVVSLTLSKYEIRNKNPCVQIMMFKNITPSPFLKFCPDDREQVLVDVERKDYKQIGQHFGKIFGKSEKVAEAEAKMQASNLANFGTKKYCLRECICEAEGQVPCPGTTPLHEEMTGKYRARMAESQEREPNRTPDLYFY